VILPAEAALPPAGAPGTPCHVCDSPLASDQRYCLVCGTRRGAGGPIDFAGLLGGSGPGAPPPAGRGRAARALRGPAPVAATMLAALLGTGILLGSLTSSPTLAAGVASPLGVVVQAPAVAAPPAAAAIAAPPPAPLADAAPVASSEPAPPADEPAPGASPPAASSPAREDTSGATKKTGDGATSTTGATATERQPATSPIEHVFVIRLGEQAVARPFAAGPATPYLGTTLAAKGTLLPDLSTVADSGLADSIALLSGQGPNAQTTAGCPTFTDVAPDRIGAHDQQEGEGCAYSAQVPALPSQLAAKDVRWRAYVEDQAAGGPGVAKGCRRPAAGTADPWREPRPGDGYLTARNPFVYFHAITDTPDCEQHVVDLAELDDDLEGQGRRRPGVRLHRARPLPRRAGDAVRRRGPGGRGNRRRLPRRGRAEDPALQGVRDVARRRDLRARDHAPRPAAGERAGREGRGAAHLALRPPRPRRCGPLRHVLAAGRDRGCLRPRSARTGGTADAARARAWDRAARRLPGQDDAVRRRPDIGRAFESRRCG
jgi:hypothetical protein